jgi:excisionase family DNA binding protein
MTLAEAAKVLGVDPGTLRVQIHKGKLKGRKIGPIWTVTPKEVERYRRESLGVNRGLR